MSTAPPTASLRLPTPGSFEHLLVTKRVPISKLVRLSRSPSTEPYWGRRMVYRFDDPNPDPGARFGVTYAGLDLQVAFCESVIHEAALFVGDRYVVARADLDARHAVRYMHKSGGRKSLELCDLTGNALKALGLNGDICAGNDYTIPQLWSAAIHRALPDVDGILYRSRQLNDGLAAAVFDRSGLTCAPDPEALSSMSELAGMLSDFNVAII